MLNKIDPLPCHRHQSVRGQMPHLIFRDDLEANGFAADDGSRVSLLLAPGGGRGLLDTYARVLVPRQVG